MQFGRDIPVPVIHIGRNLKRPIHRSPMSERPNLLFFITDQLRADHLDCYGNRAIRTPAIDSLAARGVSFDRFYVASPVCQPNRATLMTGRMPSLHGVRYNGISLSLNATTFVDLLRAVGWRTALIGKSHLQNMTGVPTVVPPPKPAPDYQPPPPGLDEAEKDDRNDDAYAPGKWHRLGS